MHEVQPALPLREDTFLGVCEGLGEDLRIPSNLIRIAFAGLLFWNPLAALGAYTAAGMLVLFSRLLFPRPRIASSQAAEAAVARDGVAQEAEAEPVALAA